MPAQIETTSRSIGNGLDWDCFSSSTSRAPRSSCAFDALIQVGTECGEGLQLAVLGQVDPQPPGY